MITERPRASAAPLLHRGRRPERQPGTGPKWEPAHGSLSVGGIQDRPTSGVNAITPRKLYACTAPRTGPPTLPARRVHAVDRQVSRRVDGVAASF